MNNVCSDNLLLLFNSAFNVFVCPFEFSRISFESHVIFLHFAEQNQRTVPSFLTNIVPVPFATGRSQKLHGFTNRLMIITNVTSLPHVQFHVKLVLRQL